MKIGHFIPTYRPCCDGLVMQIPREEYYLHGRLNIDYQPWCERTSDIATLRNRAVDEAINRGLDYLCMQDSDIFSKSKVGAITLLLETMMQKEATMVAAICGLRRDPPEPNVRPVQPGEVYEGTRAGTGLVLFDVAKLKELREKEGRLFDREYNEHGTSMETGEDIWLCKLILKHGGSIIIDGRVPTTHGMEDFKTLDYPGAVSARSESHTDTQPQQGAQ